MRVDETRKGGSGWTWSSGLHIVYHPRGCTTCMEYGRHIMEAEFTKDDEYVVASEQRQGEADYWRRKATKYIDDLEEAEGSLRRMGARIDELEREIECSRDYEDGRGGKRARYESPYEGGSGISSPATNMPVRSQQPSRVKEDSYAQAVQTPALRNVQEDVYMEDGEIWRFPPLPNPGVPQMVQAGPLALPRGANWRPAPAARPAVSGMTRFRGNMPLRHPPMILRSMEELNQHLEAANVPGNNLALARMRAYVREAQDLPKEARSPVQNEALIKWKIPKWVPQESRPAARGVGPNTPAGINTPRLSDPPEEWARWIWRYPREADTRPGIHQGRDGISLSSIRGLLLVTGCAPRGNGVLRARNAFMIRAAELMATPGRYRGLVEAMHLNIAAQQRVTVAQPSDNVTIGDVAQLFAADGITIPQIMDGYEWGRATLQSMAHGADAS